MAKVDPKEVKERLGKLRGWVFMRNAKRLHLIDADCRSLCGRWMYLGGRFKEPAHREDQCAGCLKTYEKLQAIAATAEEGA